jgi:hypothetical protein
MRGDWVVQLEDGSHNVHAEITVGLLNKLKITWDGAVLDNSTIYLILGDIKSFEHCGHSFVVAVHGLGVLGKMKLFVDGREASTGAPALIATKGAKTPSPIFVKDLNVRETEDVVGTEQFPLDNRFGDQPFTTTRQVSRESTVELSLDDSAEIEGKIGVDILKAITAEIEANVTRQIGRKLGERITESQTLTFSVGAKQSVVYEVVWKRKVRCGERLYMSGREPVSVPYKVAYGLTCDVRTRPGQT